MLSLELYGDGATFKFEFLAIFGPFLAVLAGVQNFKVTFLLGVLQANFFYYLQRRGISRVVYGVNMGAVG